MHACIHEHIFVLLVYGDAVTFEPPLFSDAGSYWCRNKTNHSDISEGILLFKGVSVWLCPVCK